MMVFTAVLGLLVYLVSYKLIAKYKSRDLKDEIGGLFRVVGMLVSLMLSLAFGEVIVELVQSKNAVEREVIAIKDVYKDLEMFDIESTRQIRATLIDYTQAVIEDDWPALAAWEKALKDGGFRVSQIEEPVIGNKKALDVMIARLNAAIDELGLAIK
jgi:hypothetical protein